VKLTLISTNPEIKTNITNLGTKEEIRLDGIIAQHLSFISMQGMNKLRLYDQVLRPILVTMTK
jgi:hypothetical protein